MAVKSAFSAGQKAYTASQKALKYLKSGYDFGTETMQCMKKLQESITRISNHLEANKEVLKKQEVANILSTCMSSLEGMRTCARMVMIAYEAKNHNKDPLPEIKDLIEDKPGLGGLGPITDTVNALKEESEKLKKCVEKLQASLSKKRNKVGKGRSAPPHPARKCVGACDVGAHGVLYISRRGRSGVCRWHRLE